MDIIVSGFCAEVGCVKGASGAGEKGDIISCILVSVAARYQYCCICEKFQGRKVLRFYKLKKVCVKTL